MEKAFEDFDWYLFPTHLKDLDADVTVVFRLKKASSRFDHALTEFVCFCFNFFLIFLFMFVDQKKLCENV